MAYTLHLRVLDRSRKSKFSHFVLNNFPLFSLPEELKSFLLDKHATKVTPAQTINFKLGYFVEGKGNRKFDIVDQDTLKQAYANGTASNNMRITLWVDPHTPVVTATKTKKKREAFQGN